MFSRENEARLNIKYPLEDADVTSGLDMSSIVELAGAQGDAYFTLNA